MKNNKKSGKIIGMFSKENIYGGGVFMVKLLAYLKNYRKECIFAPLFKLLEVVFELMVPLVMAKLIDIGIGNQDKNYVLKMFVILIVFAVVGLISSVTAQYFAAKAAVGFAKELKHSLFCHIQSLSFTEIDQLGTSSLITRMTSDMNQVQSGVNMTLRLVLRSPFVVFGAMILAFTIDVKAALIFVVTIPLLTIVIFGIMLWCIPRYKTVQEKLDKVLETTRENLTGIRVIRAFCKEKEEIGRFHERTEELTDIQKKVGRISALMNPVTYCMINIAIGVLIWQGAIRVNVGLLTQGAVVALYNYMSQILIELIKLANLILNMTKSVACGNRIQSIFEICSSMEEGVYKEESPKENLPFVEFDHVSLRYKGAGDEALKDIHFSVKKGETVGIIGGTGSGKSSLVHLLPRFYDATEGEVRINGVDVRKYSLKELRQKVTVVLQKAVLFQGTIRENMQWGNKNATDEEIYNALTIAQAKDVVDGKRGKLDYVIEQGGKNLSGGQRQRLTIARALLCHGEILILDDSTSALDYQTDANLRKAIRNMENSPIVFIVSQRTSSIQHADKIIVLEDGKMAGVGTHEELLESCEVYQEIYYSQFKKEA